MACRNSVASEEFADFIAPYFTSPENFMRSQGTDCIDFVNSTLAVVYIPFSTITSFSYTSYTYSAIPKLYSLLDVTSMDAAGITAAGELPVLNNQGEGVLIGFVDTGIHYMDPLFRSADGSTRIIGIWDQTLPPSSETSSFFPVSGGDGSEEGSMPVFVPGWNDGGRIIGIQGQIDLGSSISGIFT